MKLILGLTQSFDDTITDSACAEFSLYVPCLQRTLEAQIRTLSILSTRKSSPDRRECMRWINPQWIHTRPCTSNKMRCLPLANRIQRDISSN